MKALIRALVAYAISNPDRVTALLDMLFDSIRDHNDHEELEDKRS